MFSQPRVHRRRVVLVVLLLVSVGLLTAYFSESASGVLHAVQRGASEALAPLEEGAARAFKPFSDFAGWVRDVAHAKRRNEQLESEVERLRGEVAGLATSRRDGEQVAGLGRLAATYMPRGTRTVTARVIVHSPTVWYATLGIDKGRADGIRVDDPVIAAGGLAGSVVDTTDTTARVALITDPSSAVAAEVVPAGVAGVIRPVVGGDNLILDYVPKQSHLRPGQAVVTSGFAKGGLRSLFPRGLPIGAIAQVRSYPLGLGPSVRVRPFANLRNVDFVGVVTGRR